MKPCKFSSLKRCAKKMENHVDPKHYKFRHICGVVKMCGFCYSEGGWEIKQIWRQLAVRTSRRVLTQGATSGTDFRQGIPRLVSIWSTLHFMSSARVSGRVYPAWYPLGARCIL